MSMRDKIWNIIPRFQDFSSLKNYRQVDEILALPEMKELMEKAEHCQKENVELRKKLHDIQADAVTIQAMNLGVDTVMEWKEKADKWDNLQKNIATISPYTGDDIAELKVKAEKWDKWGHLAQQTHEED